MYEEKKKQERLGVRYLSGCPFRLDASWDNKQASFIIKSVNKHHTMRCNRHVKVNRRSLLG